ncbi:hypothetical protein Riv7116_3430 [Rivularia sp. PCC 7116]|nr:hypothetical protein Riv7116_3430 [Rivularia sp. PCC 7116]
MFLIGECKFGRGGRGGRGGEGVEKKDVFTPKIKMCLFTKSLSEIIDTLIWIILSLQVLLFTY